jgi:EAL domain-containing protein (putative c-di-GMP-specific phosphodiesterase class I)
MLDTSHAGIIDLAHALRAGWVDFWYQPKIDLLTRKVVGVEMFARAKHPFHGVLSGGVLLAGADERAVAQLTLMAFRAALHASRIFAQAGAHVPITVNVSSNAVEPQFLAALFAQGPQHEDWPGLVLDVPKNELLFEHERLAGITQELAALRVRLAADDFCGRLRQLMRTTNPEALFDEMEALSGQLTKLKALSISEMKLDRELIAGCSEDKTRGMLCSLIVDLIHQLDAKAVAVGVEKRADIAMLQEIGCDIAQGQAFTPPLALDDLIAVVKKRSQYGVSIKTVA